MKYHWLCFLSVIVLVHSANDCGNKCLECNSLNKTCSKCSKGYYIHEDNCVEKCNEDLYADNYSMKCKKMKDNPVYIKAYTFSRCINSCGRNFKDCSCSEECRHTGSCCSDFRFCEILSENQIEAKEQKSNCQFTTEDKKICLQCKENFYYYNNDCVEECPIDTIVLEENRLCIQAGKCSGNLKDRCENCDSNGKCLECTNGFFLHEGNCLKVCPIGLNANRINFTCQKKDLYSFYWIFPSKNTCKDQCGTDLSSNEDCSCNGSCLRRGNCCDDFEKYCEYDFNLENSKVYNKEDKNIYCQSCNRCEKGICQDCKKNSVLNQEGQCICRENTIYDLEEDRCVKEDSYPVVDLSLIPHDYKNKTKLTAKEVVKGKKPIIAPIKLPRPSLAEELISSFQSLFSFNNLGGKQNGQNTVGMNGNSTINIYSANKNLKVKTRNVKNRNSFNTKSNLNDNINSKNLIIPGIISNFNSGVLTKNEVKNPLNNMNFDIDLEKKILNSLVDSKGIMNLDPNFPINFENLLSKTKNDKEKEFSNKNDKNKTTGEEVSHGKIPFFDKNSPELINQPYITSGFERPKVSLHPDLSKNLKEKHLNILKGDNNKEKLPTEFHKIVSKQQNKTKLEKLPEGNKQKEYNNQTTLVNNNIVVHNNIYLHDYSVSMIGGTNANLFSINFTGKDENFTQGYENNTIYILKGGLNSTDSLLNKKENNMIIINQGDNINEFNPKVMKVEQQLDKNQKGNLQILHEHPKNVIKTSKTKPDGGKEFKNGNFVTNNETHFPSDQVGPSKPLLNETNKGKPNQLNQNINEFKDHHGKPDQQEKHIKSLEIPFHPKNNETKSVEPSVIGPSEPSGIEPEIYEKEVQKPPEIPSQESETVNNITQVQELSTKKISNKFKDKVNNTEINKKIIKSPIENMIKLSNITNTGKNLSEVKGSNIKEKKPKINGTEVHEKKKKPKKNALNDKETKRPINQSELEIKNNTQLPEKHNHSSFTPMLNISKPEKSNKTHNNTEKEIQLKKLNKTGIDSTTEKNGKDKILIDKEKMNFNETNKYNFNKPENKNSNINKPSNVTKKAKKPKLEKNFTKVNKTYTKQQNLGPNNKAENSKFPLKNFTQKPKKSNKTHTGLGGGNKTIKYQNINKVNKTELVALKVPLIGNLTKDNNTINMKITNYDNKTANNPSSVIPNNNSDIHSTSNQTRNNHSSVIPNNNSDIHPTSDQTQNNPSSSIPNNNSDIHSTSDQTVDNPPSVIPNNNSDIHSTSDQTRNNHSSVIPNNNSDIHSTSDQTRNNHSSVIPNNNSDIHPTSDQTVNNHSSVILENISNNMSKSNKTYYKGIKKLNKTKNETTKKNKTAIVTDTKTKKPIGQTLKKSNKSETMSNKIKRRNCNEDFLCEACIEGECRLCKSFTFYNKIENYCHCKSHFFKNVTAKVCSKCHPMCNECSGGTQNECISCIEHAYIAKIGRCECAVGYVFDDITQKCVNPEDIFIITHLKPKTCKSGLYWEKRVGDCVENPKNRTKELKFSMIFYLGGTQSPKGIDEKGKDLLHQRWGKNKQEALSPVGMRQDYISGRYFKEKYFNFYSLLDKGYNSNQIKIFASGKESAMKSSYSFILGMFPTLGENDNEDFYNSNEYSTIDDNEIDDEDTMDYKFEKKINEGISISSNQTSKSQLKTGLKNRFGRIKELSVMDNTYLKRIEDTSYLEIENNADEPNNPFAENGELEFSLDEQAIVLPLVASHSALQGFSTEYGISELQVCHGAVEFIKQNTQNNKQKANEIIDKIKSKLNLKRHFGFTASTSLSYEFMVNLTLAYYSNLGVNNKNITKNYITREVRNLFQELYDILTYENHYGDKHDYLAKAILTPYLEKFMVNAENAIDSEYSIIIKMMRNYKKNGIIDWSIYDDYLKLNIIFPEDQIFWAFKKFVEKFLKKKEQLQKAATGFTFELAKNKIKGLNLTEFITKYSQYIDNDNVVKKSKKYTNKTSSDTKKDDAKLTKNKKTRKDMDDKDKKHSKEAEKKAKESIDTENNAKDTKDTGNNSKKKSGGNKNTKNNSTVISVSNKITNSHELDVEMKRLFKNRNLYSIKIYNNHNLFFEKSYAAFRSEISDFIVDKEEFQEFCFPKSTDIWFIICLALFASIIFELLVIACIFTVKD